MTCVPFAILFNIAGFILNSTLKINFHFKFTLKMKAPWSFEMFLSYINMDFCELFSSI